MDVHDRFGPVLGEPAPTQTQKADSTDRLAVLPGVKDETSEDTTEVTPRNNDPAVTVANARQAASAATKSFLPKLGGGGQGVLAEMEEVVAAPSTRPSAVAPATKPSAKVAISNSMDTCRQVDALFTEAAKRQAVMGAEPQELSEKDLHALPGAIRDDYRSRLDAFKSAAAKLTNLVGTLPKNLAAQFVEVKGTIGYKLSKSLQSQVAAQEGSGAYEAIDKFTSTEAYKNAKAEYQQARDNFRGVLRNADSFLTAMTALKCFSKAGSEAMSLQDLDHLQEPDPHVIEEEIMHDPDAQGKEEKAALFGVLTHALAHPVGVKLLDIRSQMLEHSLMSSARCIKPETTPFQTDCGAIQSFSRQWNQAFNENGIRKIVSQLVDLMAKTKIDLGNQTEIEKHTGAILERVVTSVEAMPLAHVKDLGQMMNKALAQLLFPKNNFVKDPAAYTVSIFFLRVMNPQLAQARVNLLDKSMMPQCIQLGKCLQTLVNSYSQNPDENTPVKPLFDRLAKALTGSAPGEIVATTSTPEESGEDEFNAFL